MSASFYVDESGDTGWKFNAPYRHGGSSRYLTIASLVCPPAKDHLPKRIVANLYRKFHWNPKKEKKWADMSQEPRKFFAEEAKNLILAYSDIKLFSITVLKTNVNEHIRRDCNRIYNYMIRLSLIDEMCKYGNINFIPDPRSIKIESKTSLHDYLDMFLMFDKGTTSILNTKPCDSANNRNIQFADMLAGAVQNHHEDTISGPWHILEPHVDAKTLYF